MSIVQREAWPEILGSFPKCFIIRFKKKESLPSSKSYIGKEKTEPQSGTVAHGGESSLVSSEISFFQWLTDIIHMAGRTVRVKKKWRIQRKVLKTVLFLEMNEKRSEFFWFSIPVAFSFEKKLFCFEFSFSSLAHSRKWQVVTLTHR